MAYGLKYQTQFTSQSDDNTPSKLYTLQFEFLDYSGGATSLTGGSTTVIQKCTVDDPFAPIKGQSLEIRLLNYGNLPITAFYHDSDVGVRVRLLDSIGAVLFIGFIVQDDIAEPMIDYVHEIALSANDSLGLLKGVILSDVFNQFLTLEGKNFLSDVIRDCLLATGLELDINVFCNVFEMRQFGTGVMFIQTLIDTKTFYSGQTYDNCYNVLTKILETFHCSLFQANGQWNIVHWNEVRQYPAWNIPGFSYDSLFALIGNIVFTSIFNIGADPQLTRPLAGLMKQAVRGYKFSRKTFNYDLPKYLLRNYDLTKVGVLRSQYSSGGLNYFEYEATDWGNGFGTNIIDRFIRVIQDPALQDSEVDRYIVLRGPTFDSPRSVQAIPIEANKGDKIKLSFSYRTPNNSNTVTVFAVRLYDGTNNRYISDSPVGQWVTGVGYSQVVPPPLNGVWHDFSVESDYMPFNGLLYIYLSQVTADPQNFGKETHYKNIRLEYTAYINDITKIKGQIHKNERTIGPKQNLDLTINIDDGERNFFSGTLFLNSATGVAQDRTRLWSYAIKPGEAARLGELTAKEEMLWRGLTRTKLDGSFIGLYQGVVISLLTGCETIFDPTKKYIFGLLTIDYKHNQCNGTLWEILDTAEPALVSEYTFKYIYSTD